MAETALDISGLTAGYVRGLPVIRDIDLVAEAGRLTVIIGPNGAGKSTLIKAVAGLVPITAGSIRLGGHGITAIRADEMTGLGLAYVPQTDNVFRTLTIRENLALSLRRHADPAGRIEALFDLFPPLAEKRAEKAGALSGGQRQMLALALALANEPLMILMDEPSAGLSPRVAEEVLTLARSLTREGVTILLVEQNVRQALQIADHAYLLADGRNQLDGPASELLADPVIGEIYLGGRRIAASDAGTP